MNWQRLFQLRDKSFTALTGLTRNEFERLLPTFHAAEQQAFDATRKTARQRARGAGRKGALATSRDKLLFILVYVNLYPIQELQGVLFDLSQPEACFWIHRLLAALRRALDREVALPARPATATLDGLQALCPDLHFLLDGTERPIRRAQQDEQQRAHYSGKKKRHMVKNTIITNATGRRVVFLGATRAGSVHDKRAADEDAPPFPPGSAGRGDSGYQGYHADNLTMTTPTKKPKGGGS